MEKLVQKINAYLATMPLPKNWVLMLISFCMALTLWYFVVGEDKVDMTVTIPVEIVNLPRDLVISNQYKKQLEVTVSGQRRIIQSITTQQITRTIDLSSATPGKVKEIVNSPESISLPHGISILRIQPPKITLLLERELQRELPIRPVTMGKPPSGYKLLSTTINPPIINITGPESIIGKERFLQTSPIDISDFTEPTSKEVTLDLQPAIADLIGEAVVTVHFNVVVQTTERLVPNIPIEYGTANDKGYTLKPPTIAVRAQIPENLLRETSDLKTLFRAMVDPGSLSAENHELTISLTPAPGVQIIKFTPVTTTLEINETKKLKIKASQPAEKTQEH